MSILSERVRALRLERGETQTDLANALGVSSSGISMIEGAKREPSVAMIRTIAEYFGVDFNFLLGFEAPLEKAEESPEIHCNFCGKPQSEARKMIICLDYGFASVCEDCIEKFHDINLENVNDFFCVGKNKNSSFSVLKTGFAKTAKRAQDLGINAKDFDILVDALVKIKNNARRG